MQLSQSYPKKNGGHAFFADLLHSALKPWRSIKCIDTYIIYYPIFKQYRSKKLVVQVMLSKTCSTNTFGNTFLKCTKCASIDSVNDHHKSFAILQVTAATESTAK